MIGTEQATAAVERLGALKFFPAKSEDIVRDEIAALLIRMVPTHGDLEWLVTAMIDVGQWYGPGEMRGVLCAHTDPLDGKPGRCLETPGYTADAIEALHYERRMLAPQKLLTEPIEPLTDAERAEIAVLDAKIKASAERMKITPARILAAKPAAELDGYAEWQRKMEQAGKVQA